MNKRNRGLLASLLVALFVSPSVLAAIVNAPLPSNTFITRNGYDWAWAFPVAPDGIFGQGSTSPTYFIDLSYQSQYGWRLPTAAELLLAPNAVDFVFTGANVPLNGTDPLTGANIAGTTPQARPAGATACATPYFATFYRECDWVNGRGIASSDWWSPDKAYGSGAGKQLSTTDTLVLRLSSAVPVPAAIWLFGSALSLMGVTRRKVRHSA